jgi:hypothetical protein
LAVRLQQQAQFVESGFHFEGCVAEAMSPRENLLLLMDLCMDLHAVGAERFQAVDVDAEIGDFFARVFVALQPRMVRPLHLTSYKPIINQSTISSKRNKRERKERKRDRDRGRSERGVDFNCYNK